MTSLSLKLMNLPQCPACRSSKRDLLFKVPDTQVYGCSSCGLRYLDPCLDPEAMKDAYESEDSLKSMHDFHEGYYEYGDLNTPSQTLHDFQRGLDLLEKACPQKGRILDVGFGNGLFLAAAKKRGWQVQGIDSSTSNIETAKKKFGLELTRAPWEEFSSSEKFDAIAFWDLLEHFPDPNTAIQKVRAHLKPNGAVLFAVPNDDSFLAFLAITLYRLGLKKSIQKIYLLEHVCYYSIRTLSSLLKANGFSLSDSFNTSTDLAKYRLSFKDKVIASVILALGSVLGKRNRMVAVFTKIPA